MRQIEVITGVRFRPEQVINSLSKKKKYKHIKCTYVNSIYSPCWVLEFRVLLQASPNTTRYAGYYAGIDELNLTPGKIQMLPSAENMNVDDFTILENKVDEKTAVDMAWEYNKNWIIIKFKNLYAPPVLEQYKLHLYYKVLYVIEFCNLELGEKKHLALDSLTGDLEPIAIEK